MPRDRHGVNGSHKLRVSPGPLGDDRNPSPGSIFTARPRGESTFPHLNSWGHKCPSQQWCQPCVPVVTESRLPSQISPGEPSFTYSFPMKGFDSCAHLGAEPSGLLSRTPPSARRGENTETDFRSLCDRHFCPTDHCFALDLQDRARAPNPPPCHLCDGPASRRPRG